MSGRQYWSDHEVSTMLNTFIDKQILSLLDGKKYRKNAILEVVVSELSDKGFTRTAQQIRHKWTTLKSDYAKAQKHNNTSGFNRTTCPFYDQLEELLGSRPAVTSLPQGVQSLNHASSRSVNVPSLEDISVTNSDEEDTPEDSIEHLEGPSVEEDDLYLQHFIAELGSETQQDARDATRENEDADATSNAELLQVPPQPGSCGSTGQKGSYATALKTHAEDGDKTTNKQTETFIQFFKESDEKYLKEIKEHEKDMSYLNARLFAEGMKEISRTIYENAAALIPPWPSHYPPPHPSHLYPPQNFFSSGPHAQFSASTTPSPDHASPFRHPPSTPINILASNSFHRTRLFSHSSNDSSSPQNNPTDSLSIIFDDGPPSPHSISPPPNLSTSPPIINSPVQPSVEEDMPFATSTQKTKPADDSPKPNSQSSLYPNTSVPPPVMQSLSLKNTLKVVTNAPGSSPIPPPSPKRPMSTPSPLAGTSTLNLREFCKTPSVSSTVSRDSSDLAQSTAGGKAAVPTSSSSSILKSIIPDTVQTSVPPTNLPKAMPVIKTPTLVHKQLKRTPLKPLNSSLTGNDSVTNNKFKPPRNFVSCDKDKIVPIVNVKSSVSTDALENDPQQASLGTPTNLAGAEPTTVLCIGGRKLVLPRPLVKVEPK